ncbi:type I restriction endonuclease [Campylobacter sp. MIT 12-8780]|uniref:restriction endonuclease subunit S n=1 Tax=unclassified Campylobacter TaxID=2593542 RepID=UPI00115DF36A|nr:MULTISPECIES: restriction endonuclease subunit S [unclassified Campylobacter]NDJ26981.1 restriction endonuclease subunit S [Campylobacter sp. MIT 19-121]TQR41878.1 type I restriction endonuclease [Campylobacter sp. MIT 12-8780]
MESNFFQSLQKESWEEVRLEKIIKLKYGKEHKSLNNGNIPTYGSGGIIRYVDTSIYNNKSILIPRKGTLNNIFYTEKPFWVVDTMFYSIIDLKLAYAKFLYYKLKTIDFRLLNVGTAVPSLTTQVIYDITIPLPPLKTQEKIAQILSSFDDKIDLLHKQNKTLEILAQTLFRHHFIENAKESWEVGKLGDLIKVKRGKNITKKDAVFGIYPVIAGGVKPACYHNQSNTKSPVITISASGTAGYVSIHYTPVWASDSSFIDESVTPYIYFCYLFLKMNQEVLYGKQEGSVQPHIYPSHIMDLELLKYPKEKIEKFEKEISIYFDKISHNAREIQNLESLRDIVLKRILE